MALSIELDLSINLMAFLANKANCRLQANANADAAATANKDCMHPVKMPTINRCWYDLISNHYEAHAIYVYQRAPHHCVCAECCLRSLNFPLQWQLLTKARALDALLVWFHLVAVASSLMSLNWYSIWWVPCQAIVLGRVKNEKLNKLCYCLSIKSNESRMRAFKPFRFSCSVQQSAANTLNNFEMSFHDK